MDGYDLQKMDSLSVAKLFSASFEELSYRNIIRSDDILQDLGDFFVFDLYEKKPVLPYLAYAPNKSTNVSAVTRNGNRYCIKSFIGNSADNFLGFDETELSNSDFKMFEYVILCKFDKHYELLAIYEIDWFTFLENRQCNDNNTCSLKMTNRLLKQAKIIYHKD